MNFDDKLGLFLAGLLWLLIALYIWVYTPQLSLPQVGDCIKYREARHQSLFSSSRECIKWKE